MENFSTYKGKKRKEKKFEASLLQQLCFRVEKREGMSSGEQSFHNLYEFLLHSHQLHRNCILENCSDGISEVKEIFVLYGERNTEKNVSEF